MDFSSLEVILIAIIALSEALALIPALESNTVLQLVYKVAKAVKEKLPKIKKTADSVKELVDEVKDKIEKK